MGIFPYVLKLLQTSTPELRQILVFIWTKILALDKVNLGGKKRKKLFLLFSHFVMVFSSAKGLSSVFNKCNLV